MARFMRADTRRVVGDYQGAMQDLHFVLDNIDANAVKAVQDLKDFYAREGKTWKNPNADLSSYADAEKATESSRRRLSDFTRLIPEHVPPPPTEMECKHCKRRRTKLHFCSRCRGVRYCGAECQRRDWQVHKPQCKKAAT